MNQISEQPQWHTMPTQILLERAYAFADQHQDGETTRCIHALAWRLKGSEEWIESLNRRIALRTEGAQ